MRGKIIVSVFWTRFFSLGKARAITLFPFIFLKRQQDRLEPALINHERIHIRQALELLVIPFYFCYLIEFCFRFIQCRDFQTAYRTISFEREAYAKEQDLSYLDHRGLWSFYRYL
ncbi:MAG: hypothetical protein ACTHZ1_08400 [Sphingobacterium sp.]